MQNTTNSKYTRAISYLIVGILFALSHLLPWQLIVPYMLISFGFSFVADKFKSIGLVIFAHTLVDFLLFLLQYFELTDIKAFEENMVLGVGVGTIVTLVAVAMLMVHTPSPSQEGSLAQKPLF